LPRGGRRKPPFCSRHFEFHHQINFKKILNNKRIHKAKPEVRTPFHYPTKN